MALPFAYWGVCAVVTWIGLEAIVGTLGSFFAFAALLCATAFTILRVRSGLSFHLVLFAFFALAGFDGLAAWLFRAPIGYGGQAAGVFFLVPIGFWTLGLVLDVYTRLRAGADGVRPQIVRKKSGADARLDGMIEALISQPAGLTGAISDSTFGSCHN